MKYKLFVFLLLIISSRVYGQCTLNTTLTTPNPVVCSGITVDLTATPSGGTAPYTYAWSTGETAKVISVNKAGTYTVTVTDNAGCNAVKSINITAGNVPVAPTSKDEIACPNTSAKLTATAPGGIYQWFDAPVGGNFLGTGATYQTPPITVKSVFYVQTTIDGCTSARTPVTVYPIAPPDGTGATTCPGGAVVLTATGAGDYRWYATPGGAVLGTSSSFTTPNLFTTTTYYVVGITAGCTSTPVPVVARVKPTPTAPASPGVQACAGSPVTLHATADRGAIFDWYATPNGGAPLISSPDFTTPVLNSSVTYYVQATVDGCISARTPVTVNVNPITATPTVADVQACAGTPISIQATAPTGVFRWYSTSTAATPLFEGNPYIGTFTSSTVVYVEAESAGCKSARKAVNITVKPAPPAPTAANQTICQGNIATLTASSPSGTYNWFNVPTGGTALLTNSATFVTPALNATTVYYVENIVNGCPGLRKAVTVTVDAAPAAPSVTGTTTVCSGSLTTLTASGAGSSFEWFDVPFGGSPVASTAIFTTPVLTADKTYYVQTTSGCSSARTAVTITVLPTPAIPTASNITSCAGAAVTLTASGAANLQWFDTPTGGTLLFTGASYTTTVASTTTFYVQSFNGTCASPRRAVTVTVSSPSIKFNYASGTYCQSGIDPLPTTTVTGGVYSCSDPNLVFVDANTGQIDLSASLPGFYTITLTQGCSITTSKVFIVVTPDASFRYSTSEFCKTAGDQPPMFNPLTVSTPGVFTASSADLVFVNKTTGAIDVSASKPGTYTITNTIDAVGGCPLDSATQVITIYPPVTVNAGPDQTVAEGTPEVQLAGSIGGSASSGTWSGGAGTFSPGNTTLNARYIPAPGETGAITLTLTSDAPASPNICGPRSNQVVININPIPPDPTITGTAVCSGSSAQLKATAPTGATFTWYTAATGGTSIFTGATFNTPSLTTTTTYYVQAIANGVPSTNRTAVTAIVNTAPAAPSITTPMPVNVCLGNAATLTATGATATGIYRWYTVPSGGATVFTGNTFTTQFLIANATFYVDITEGTCTGPRTRVDINVNPTPTVNSASASSVCNGNAVNYTITANLPGTTFNWRRDAVAGISNPAVSNQTSGIINETLDNITGSAITVVYVITPTLNGCPGPPFEYDVTVYPSTAVTSGTNLAVCSGDPQSSGFYTIQFNTPVSNLSWSRAAVPGISNAAVSGQVSTTLYETLRNTTTAPINVNYVFNYSPAQCPTPATFTVTVTVNPKVHISSADEAITCSSEPFNYTITSDVPSAVFNWRRNAVAGISNPATTQTSGRINETLINTTAKAIEVRYIITTAANGCQDAPFIYKVTVKPQPPQPQAFSNSPICENSTLYLVTPPAKISGSTYYWTGPNNFKSTDRNPNIAMATQANSGIYTLYTIFDGCTSVASLPVDVRINANPIAQAGPDQTVCLSAPTVTLNGSIGGGTATGIWSKKTGTGNFTDPANLSGDYIPSAADRAAGSIVLTLTSTSPDDCVPATDDLVITFGKVPGTDAGLSKAVCSQDITVPLAGKMIMNGNGKWSTSGTGNFYTAGGVESNIQVNGAASPDYRPSAADIAAGSVTITLTGDNANDPCYTPTSQVVITFAPPPKITANPTKYLLKGNTTTLTPTVTDDNVTYLWSPAVGLSSTTIKNPVVTGDVSRTYQLTVTDVRGCVSVSSNVQVIISPKIIIPNAFTPNGDGVNDIWDITGLIAYPNAMVDVFDRNGQRVFHANNYSKPWDGTYNGGRLPLGTYYYIIDPKMYGLKYSGYLSLVR